MQPPDSPPPSFMLLVSPTNAVAADPLAQIAPPPGATRRLSLRLAKDFTVEANGVLRLNSEVTQELMNEMLCVPETLTGVMPIELQILSEGGGGAAAPAITVFTNLRVQCDLQDSNGSYTPERLQSWLPVGERQWRTLVSDGAQPSNTRNLILNLDYVHWRRVGGGPKRTSPMFCLRLSRGHDPFPPRSPSPPLSMPTEPENQTSGLEGGTEAHEALVNGSFESQDAANAAAAFLGTLVPPARTAAAEVAPAPLYGVIEGGNGVQRAASRHDRGRSRSRSPKRQRPASRLRSPKRNKTRTKSPKPGHEKGDKKKNSPKRRRSREKSPRRRHSRSRSPRPKKRSRSPSRRGRSRSSSPRPEKQSAKNPSASHRSRSGSPRPAARGRGLSLFGLPTPNERQRGLVHAQHHAALADAGYWAAGTPCINPSVLQRLTPPPPGTRVHFAQRIAEDTIENDRFKVSFAHAMHTGLLWSGGRLPEHPVRAVMVVRGADGRLGHLVPTVFEGWWLMRWRALASLLGDVGAGTLLYFDFMGRKRLPDPRYVDPGVLFFTVQNKGWVPPRGDQKGQPGPGGRGPAAVQRHKS